MMLTFKQFLDENVSGWQPNSGDAEHDEVGHQLTAHNEHGANFHPSVVKGLQHLSDKRNYANALRNAKTEVFKGQKIKKVGNTDAGSSGWAQGKRTLDSDKARRADRQAAQQKSGKKLSMPIVMRVRNRTTGETRDHLIAGNTRLMRHASRGVPVQVIHHEHD